MKFRKIFTSLVALTIVLSMLSPIQGKAAVHSNLLQVKSNLVHSNLSSIHTQSINGDEIPELGEYSIVDMDISPNGDGKFDSTDLYVTFNSDQPYAFIEVWDALHQTAGPNKDGYIGYLVTGQDVAAGDYIIHFDGTYISATDGKTEVMAADGVYSFVLWTANEDFDDFIIPPVELGPVVINSTPLQISAQGFKTAETNGRFSGDVSDLYLNIAYVMGAGYYGQSYDYKNKLSFKYDLTNSKGEKLASGKRFDLWTYNSFYISYEGLTLGDNKIKIYADDIVGNHTEEEYTITVIDNKPPVIKPIVTGSGGNIWFDDEVTISLDVTDELSGVNRTEYSFDNIEWIPYTGPFKTANVEQKRIYFRSFDNAGNFDYEWIFLKDDSFAPATKTKLDGLSGKYDSTWFRSDVTVTLTATDDFSGVKSTQYKVEDGEWTDYSAPFTITTEGMTKLYFRSNDYSGKTEDMQLTYIKIDKTAPVITGVENGKTYNSDVTVTYNEGRGILNDYPFPSGVPIRDNGNYTLVVTDDAGNSTTVSFKIDKPTTPPVDPGPTPPPVVNPPVDPGPTPPPVVNPPVNPTPPATGTSPADTTPPKVSGVENNGAYNKDVTITFSDGKATLNGKDFVNNTVVKAEGTYELVVTDDAGNTTTIEFTIDKKAPKVFGVGNNAVYNKNVTVTFNEGTATLNGDWFENNTIINKDGTYTLVVTDEAGNKTTVKFTIDKKAPIVTGVANNAYYNKDVTIKFNEGTATLNGKKLGNSTVVKAAGSYVVIVTDAAGNKTTVKFTIDKTAPKAPTVNNITSKTSAVTGKAEKGTTVYIYSGKKLVGKAVVNAKGEFSVKTGVQKKGVTLTVFAKDPAGNQSKSILVKVK